MAAPYIHLLRYVSVDDKTTVNLRETPGVRSAFVCFTAPQ